MSDKLYKLLKVRIRILILSICLLYIMILVCAGIYAQQAAIPTMRIMVPNPVTAFRGVSITIHPDQKSPIITAVTTNNGTQMATLINGDALAFNGLLMYDSKGNQLPATTAWEQKMALPGQEIYLAPGKSLTEVYILDQDYLFNSPGVFYVYVSRVVIGGKWEGGQMSGQARVRSPILQLTLKTGVPPMWKVVPAVPQPNPAFQNNQLSVPSYPKHQIPTTGPIATLSQISDAVHTGDLKKVKQLCYQSNTEPPPLFVADAEDAIAILTLCEALEKKFGVNPEGHFALTHSTPESFSRFLEELDPTTLKINGNEASVGTVYYLNGKFVPFPSFAFHFRKINDIWLLDSWATYQPLISFAHYNLSVENNLKEAQIFNSLTQDLENNRFDSLQDFTAVADKQMAAIDEWFMAQSLKSSLKPVELPATSMRNIISKPITFYGTGISIQPDSSLPLVTATITNGGNQAVTLMNGLMGWSLIVIGSNGRALTPTQEYYAQFKEMRISNQHQTVLMPSMSLNRVFDISHYWVIYTYGTYYVFVKTYLTVGGSRGLVQSAVLKMILEPGKPPIWEVVPMSAIPVPKPLGQNNNNPTAIPTTQN